MMKNPFLEEYDTPFGVPPFGEIELEHYLPAFERGMEAQRAEVSAIVENPDSPTFSNTVEALERSGALLDRVSSVFQPLLSADTNPEMQALASVLAPKLSEHRDDISLNATLFGRVKSVYDNRETLDLSVEENTLLEETYKSFARNGAELSRERQAELRKINEELSVLSLKFGENVLGETNAFELFLDRKEDLAGLPEAVVITAREEAQKSGRDGGWLFTLHHPSLIPFLQYSRRRELRKRMFKAYVNRGDNGNERDNKTNVSRMASLRVRRAKLLGYATHADYVLEKSMAKTPANVLGLLDRLWTPALRRAKDEASEMQAMIEGEGHDYVLEPWDWWYYAEKLKKEKYELDEEALRPYFELERMRSGLFSVAGKLFGLGFEQRSDIPVYHTEAEVFEVTEAGGKTLGLLYMDLFPRASKRAGAWMTSFRKQSGAKSGAVLPLISVVCNFTKPVGDAPALLSFEEVNTLYHEFGHALHGLLSECEYKSLSGTAVPRDFVELPSQILENWASAPEVLGEIARHYKTDKPIPEEMLRKMDEASKFNQGFATVEYLAASYLDMAWHTLEDDAPRDVAEFEKRTLDGIGLMPQIISRYRSTYFSHIFYGGYSSGYYSYIWAELLDADAFGRFKETGLFNAETAESFRKNILEKGGTEDPMTLYRRFRGCDPEIGPLLERRGLD
ncbi:dipeptidyl carboxypeptidase II [Fulvitalea axinellae]|uniref:Dipeptidyl carboxypeptidase II n=1 Tax=Fulvitalea axinellae TaxID=1182444 RepID=A0AAU9CVR6_9BACT|nr:dipeptidyl carboxypeptidase II [Fulvitalea axinellae]